MGSVSILSVGDIRNGTPVLKLHLELRVRKLSL